MKNPFMPIPEFKREKVNMQPSFNSPKYQPEVKKDSNQKESPKQTA